MLDHFLKHQIDSGTSFMPNRRFVVQVFSTSGTRLYRRYLYCLKRAAIGKMRLILLRPFSMTTRLRTRVVSLYL
jgi:hypothetical protein